MPKTINLTPSWVGIMPALIMGVQSDSQIAKDELMRLAREVDNLNKKNKEGK